MPTVTHRRALARFVAYVPIDLNFSVIAAVEPLFATVTGNGSKGSLERGSAVCPEALACGEPA